MVLVLLAVVAIWVRAHWESLFGLKLESYSDLGQFATAVIAVVASFLAGWQLVVQREVSRQRTAFDFFFKTEMEEELWQSYQKSRDLFKKLREGQQFPIGTDNYYVIRKYLNIHELMSVGIDQDVLDDHVCYYYWADELIRDYESAEKFITELRKVPSEATQYTYSDLEKTYSRWKKRRAWAQSPWRWLHLR